MSIERSEQELVRRESLKKLRELGVNCYPAELYKVDNYSRKIKEVFKEVSDGKTFELLGTRSTSSNVRAS